MRAIISSLLLLTARLAAADESTEDQTIVEIAVATEELSTLVAAVTAADLVDTLNGDGPFTVFAPTNDAFDGLPEGTLESLLNDTDALTNVLLYHVVAGEAFSTDLSDGMMIETVQGSNVTVSIDDTVMINDATVTTADVDASNGVIHIIDTVLIPPGDEPTEPEPVEDQTIVEIAVATEELSTLVAAVTAAGLVDTLSGEGPFTVFAPTNDAFDELPEGTLDSLLNDTETLTDILLYHVVDGEAFSTDLSDGMMIETLQGGNVTVSIGDTVMINDATVTTADVDASNGVIHIIDAVLLPMENETTVSPTMMPEDGQTIVEIAIATEELSTLVTAVTAAGLVDTLAGDGPFTVFAPTNDAFDGLPEGTLETLLNDTDALSEVLLYHVVGGEAFSTDLSDGMMLETVQGSQLTVSIGDTVMINDATVTTADVDASNGVIHIIDSVLIPPAEVEENCTDSTTWFKTDEPEKDCAWVAEFVPARCDAKGFDKTLASYSCPAACGTECGDSETWYKTDEPSKDCTWVASFLGRCDAKGADATFAFDACPVACAAFSLRK